MKNKELILLAMGLLLFSCGKKGTSSIISSSETSLPEPSATISEPISSDPISESVVSSSSEPEPVSYYDGYYASLVSWKDSGDLKKQLHAIISSGTYKPLDYVSSEGANWASCQRADQSLFDFECIDPIYTNSDCLKTETNVTWQREHAFCASLMTGSLTADAVKEKGRATDFHNLFAADSSANTSRGNKNYGYADPVSGGYTDRTTNSGDDGYRFDTYTFEPGNKDKGRVARAIFYMATMYTDDVLDSSNQIQMKGLTIQEDNVDFVKGNDCAFAIGNLSDLLRWNTYSVDRMEYQHNEMVYSYIPSSDPEKNYAQGNRNPYIDFPELVDYVFGDKKNEEGRLCDLTPTCSTLNTIDSDTSYYALQNAKREYYEGESFHTSDFSVVSVGYDFSVTEYTGYALDGIAEGEEFTKTGTYTIAIATDKNTILYDITVKSPDMDSASWSYQFIGKKTGGEFEGIDKNCGQDNLIEINGIEWYARFESGYVSSTNASLGVQFGTATNPVGTLTFTSKEDFSYDAKSDIHDIYFKGSAASKCKYDLNMYIDDTSVYSGSIGYVDSVTPSVLSCHLDSSKTGKVKIVIGNITKAVYVHSIAVNVI